ncbi:MAG: Ig-like domain-containing protein, partial [Polyangiales bacterium]
MKNVMWWSGLALGVSIVAGGASRVYACSCVPMPIYDSTPAGNATHVERNRALLISGAFAAGSAVLEDADGKPVPVEVNEGPTPGCAGTWAELVPKAPLAESATYVVRIEPLYTREQLGDDYPTSITFTTGTSLLPDVAPEPLTGTVRGSVITSAPPGGLCDLGAQFACTHVADRKNVELVARRGDKVLMRTLLPEDYDSDDIVYTFDEAPDCLELRRRTATGQRSEAITVCGDALASRPFESGDRDRHGVTQCHDGVFGGGDDAVAADAGRPHTRPAPAVDA